MEEEFRTYVKELVREALREELVAYFKERDEKNRPPRYYTISQVCEMMGIKRSTYFTRAQRGDFKIIKNGHATLIDAKDFDKKFERGYLRKNCRVKRYWQHIVDDEEDWDI